MQCVHTRSHRHRTIPALAVAALAVAALAALWAAPATAQEDRDLKPELMLLVDGSSSMHAPASDEAAAACLPRAGAALPAPPPDNNRRALSRMNLIKLALAGTPEPIEQYACIAENQAIDPQFDKPALGADRVPVSVRSMCCTLRDGARCARWRPCGDDSLVFDDDLADPDRHIRRDGLIHANETRIKFGLMTSDGDPRVAGSYGTEHDALQVPADIALQADVIGAGVVRPNLGVRPPTAAGGVPVPGDLISGHRGVLNDGNLRADVAVGEDPDSVRRHNAMVMRQLRAFVPGGPSPMVAMLHDLDTYYTRLENGAPDERDAAHLCRRKVVVLFTDGGSTEFYRDPTADPAADPCVGDCRRDGYPYRPLEELAGRLAARGVEPYVIAFDHPDADVARAEGLARALAAGAPDDARDDRPLDSMFFTVRTPEDIRAALGRISSRTLSGTRTRTRPLVVTPGAGDVALDEDLREIRQVRLATFSEIPADGDGGRYGRIAALEYRCAEVQDEDAAGPVPLELARLVQFTDELAVQERRTAVAGNPAAEGGLLEALGSEDAVFDADGEVQPGAGLTEEQLRELADAPIGDGDVLGGDPLDDVADVIDGFFGGGGIVVDDDGNEVRGQRQLGEIFDGDLVAVPPPRLAVENPAFAAYARARRERPTIIAAGARDGQIHFFRLADAVEVFTFIPRLSWRNLRDGVDNPGLGALNADGPLVAGEVARCRSLGDGGGDCPAEDGAIDFRTLVVGGLGGGGPNLFAVDLSEATAALSAPDPTGRIDGNAVRAWDVVNDPSLADLRLFADTTRQVPRLGLSVSRPLLTHVRIDDEVRATVVVGCGDDRNAARALLPDVAGEGRCVLLLDAVTGAVLRRFEQGDGVVAGFQMSAPMVGSPVGFPTGGIQAADRVYIGDRIGRLWRIDLREPRPADWTMRVVWPPEDEDQAQGYRIGRPLVDRPNIALREDGRLVVIFGTGADPRPAGAPEGVGFPRSHVISFTEQLALGGDDVGLATETNWVLPLRTDEFLTGPPVIHRGIAYFTTVEETDGEACASRIGRLYGVHYTRTEEDRYVTQDGRTLDVVPGLPTYLTRGGQRIDDAVSLRLPPGRVAYGLALATSPACSDGDAPGSELLLNLADDGQGGGGDVDPDGARVERKSGELVDDPLDQSVFESDGFDLALDLDGRDADGNPLGNPAGRLGLFPRESLYWGSTFTR